MANESVKTLDEILEDERVEARKKWNDHAEEKEKGQVPATKRESAVFLEISNVLTGEKGYDPHLLDGLRYFLTQNGYDTKIQKMIIDGGLLPFVAPHYAKDYVVTMKLLGKDPLNQSHREQVMRILDKLKLTEDQEEYAKKHFDGKISSLEEAINFSEREIQRFLEPFKNAEIHYFLGRTDSLNKEILEETERQLLISEKKKELDAKKGTAKDIKAEILDLTDSNDMLAKGVRDNKQYLLVIEQLNTELSKANTPSEKEACIQMWKKDKEKWRDVPRGERGFFTSLIDLSIHSVDKIVCDVNSRVEETTKLVAEYEAEIVQNSEKLKENDRKLTTLNVEIAYQDSACNEVSWFTGHDRINPVEAEVIYYKVKGWYKDMLRELFKGYNFSSHVGPLSHITAKIPNTDIELLIAVMSKVGRTSTPIRDAIPRLTREANYLAKLQAAFDRKGLPEIAEDLKEFIDEENMELEPPKIPDIYIVANEAGGFIAKPIMKHYQPFGLVGDVPQMPIPEMCMIHQLPGMESTLAQQNIRDKGLITGSVKKQDVKKTCSGAVLHTVREDGTQVSLLIKEQYLKRIGLILNLMEKKFKPDSEEYKQHKAKLDEKVNLAMQKLERTTVIGDAHILSACKPGFKDAIEYLERAKLYIQQNYTHIDNLVCSEIPNGDFEKINAAHQEWGPLPHKFEAQSRALYDAIEKITNSDADPVVKDEQIKEAAWNMCTELNKIFRQKPIIGISMQLDESKERLVDTIEMTLASGGRLIFVSGNHSKGGSDDEAKELAARVKDMSERYGPNRIAIVEGQGCDLGSIGTLIEPDGRQIYFCHVTPKGGGANAIAAAQEALLREANPASHCYMFHIHSAQYGNADGTNYTISPCLQPPGTYPKIGHMKDILRGIASVDEFKNNSGLVAWEPVLGNTLERPEYDPYKQPNKPKAAAATPADVPAAAAQSTPSTQ